MTDVIALEDTSVRRGLDFDHEIECEEQFAKSCDGRAQWIDRCRSCLEGRPICRACRFALTAWLNEATTGSCKRCGFTAHSADELIEYIPLGLP